LFQKIRTCLNCGLKLKHHAKGYCKNCYEKLYYKIHKDKKLQRCKEYRLENQDKVKEWMARRLRFKDKYIMLKENPRTGKCSKCGKEIGIDIKQTQMHHIEYHENDPLKDTVELCVRCHVREHKK
jgi:hypothetical protein